MKTFLKKIIYFLVLSSLVLLILAIFPNIIIRSNASFKFTPNIETLVIGHSHSECSFNDSILTNFKNISRSGESYFYNYIKIKKVVDANPNIKNVFIEFSNNQISGMMDDWIWGYDKMSHYLPIYLPFANWDDLVLLYKNNPKDLITSLSISTRKNLYPVINSDYDYSKAIGEFIALERNLHDNITSKDLIKNNPKSYKIYSPTNLDYLRKIVDYCKAKNITVYFVRSPQHKDFEFLKNEKEFQHVKNNHFQDVELLDFNNFPIPDNHFGDFDHLNKKGSAFFSHWLKIAISEGFLNSSNKKKYIEEAIIQNSINL